MLKAIRCWWRRLRGERNALDIDRVTVFESGSLLEWRDGTREWDPRITTAETRTHDG